MKQLCHDVAEGYSNCSSKKRPEKNILLVLVIIVAYQNAKELLALRVENDKQMKNEHLCNYKNISWNKEHFKKATGLDQESFLDFFEFVYPRDDWKNIELYDSSKKLSAINQLSLYLVWLQNCFTLQHLF